MKYLLKNGILIYRKFLKEVNNLVNKVYSDFHSFVPVIMNLIEKLF